MAAWRVRKDDATGRYTAVRGEWDGDTFTEDQSFVIGGEQELSELAFFANHQLDQLPDGVIIAGMVKHFIKGAEAMGLPVDLRDDGARAYLDHILRERLYRPSRRPNSLVTVPETRKTG